MGPSKPIKDNDTYPPPGWREVHKGDIYYSVAGQCARVADRTMLVPTFYVTTTHEIPPAPLMKKGELDAKDV